MSVRSSSGSKVSGCSHQSDLSTRRGNVLKSSGFYPVAMSPTAQMAIVDHMNSHYRRLQRVKATVDTSPPKAYQLRHSPSPSRQSSRPSSRTSCGSSGSKTTYAMNREDIIKTTSKINFYMDALQREQQRLLTQVNSSNLHFRRPVSVSKGSVADSARTTAALRPRRRQDIIEKHSECFTSENPFTPRVLRSNAKSKLQEYRWYNPPRRKQSDGHDTRSASSMASSVCSQQQSPDRKGSPTESLADSVEYYERWLEDQVGQATDTRTKSTCNYVDVVNERRGRFDSVRSSIGSTAETQVRSHLAGLSAPDTGRSKPIKTMRFENVPNTATQNAEKEELQYLEFIVDVTNDVLTRGIFTNKVLKQVFQSHIEKRQGELSEERMKEGIRQLQRDLGISEENDEESDRASFGYGRIEGGTAQRARNGFRGSVLTSSTGDRRGRLPSDTPSVPRTAPSSRRQSNSEPRIRIGDGITTTSLLNKVAGNGQWHLENGHEDNSEVGEEEAERAEHKDTASEADELSYVSENLRTVAERANGSVVGSIEDDFAELVINGDDDDIFGDDGNS